MPDRHRIVAYVLVGSCPPFCTARPKEMAQELPKYIVIYADKMVTHTESATDGYAMG